MKNLFTKTIKITLILLLISTISYSQNSDYDAELAKKLQADDYGMKTYVMAFLKSGPKPSKDEETKKKLQRAHMDNINRLAEQGKLVLAGPFFGEGELRGIYIFNVDNLEDAKKLTETDPLIQSGGLIMDLHLWYGSAAIQEIKDLHHKIMKKDI